MNKGLFTDGKLRFEQVKGVGTIEVDFVPNQRVYTLIGENGVGKTKFLESLFVIFMLLNRTLQKNYPCWITREHLPLSSILFDNRKIIFKDLEHEFSVGKILFPESFNKNNLDPLEFPVIYLAAQQRGSASTNTESINKIDSKQKRLNKYLKKIISPFIFGQDAEVSLKNLNMDINLEEWIIQRAQSANPYQAKEDNREVEITTLLQLLNKIDSRIDSEFLEISGDNRVFIKIENQKRELSELSSGFTSILKMIQSIIAGYSYFTNEVQIANVRGVVLIDEIESHLHNEWQVKIIPLLKQLFPNTTFFITTHSSLVISQLEDGEAYRLQREEDGVVYGKPIPYPNNASFIDLLSEAFNVNLNQLKIERIADESQQKAKKALLELVQAELAKGENNG